MSVRDGFSARGYMILGAVGLIVLVGGFGTWAVTSDIAGAVVAQGQIEVEQNRQVVQHPDGGVVASIEVTEGAAVDAGDLLIRLDATLLTSELNIVEGQLFELMARRGRLEAERDGVETISFDPLLTQLAEERNAVQQLLDGQARLFAARAETLEREIAQLRQRNTQITRQVEGIEAQRAALDTQIELIRQELEDQQSLLDRGLAPAAKVLALRREEARLDGQRGELLAQAAQAAERATEIEIEILKLSTARREEAITRLRDLRVTELELAERRQSLLEQLSRLDIRAPVSGVVYDQQVFAPRAVVRAAEPLLYLIPQDRPLIVAARVDPTDVDQIFPGQAVIIRLPAFDSRTTPELTGEVLRVSADALTDEATRAPYYRAELRLTEDQLARLPEGLTLVPGMPVEAYLRTENRSPIVFLTKPLTDYFNRAFREG